VREKESAAKVVMLDEILSYEDVSHRLKLPRRTLERLVSKDEIPHKRIGRTVRFYWPDIMAWFHGQGANR
jgi:excisionase family DNA binding protein